MSETTLNAIVTLFIVTLIVAVTVTIVVGTVWLVYGMVTEMMDEIRERERKGTKHEQVHHRN